MFSVCVCYIARNNNNNHRHIKKDIVSVSSNDSYSKILWN